MAGAKYLGPATTVEYNGHHYVQGEVIPMPEKVLRHMAAGGHRFEGVEPSGPIQPTPKVPMFFDDQGHGHPVENKAAPAQAAAPKKD